MKKLFANIFILQLVFILFACHKKDEAAYYFSKSQQDSLLTNIITMVAENAPGATDSTRFNPKFRSYYEQKLTNFSLEKLEKSENGFYYFLLNRPVGHLTNYRRGVVGRFKLKENSLHLYAFEEVINTPHLDSETLKVRSTFLFKELVKKNQLDEYIPLKHYVEWPDSTLKYNTKFNRWEYIRRL
jgi:hypothetical protein